MQGRRWLPAAVLVSFMAVAGLQSWPLPRHLGTALTGHPGGDTGVYLWNLWLFRHEIVEHGRLPFSTQEVLALGGPADLSLHNYTLFADLLAFPLLPLLGVVTTFNLIYLFNVALAGFGMFLLAHRVTGRVAESWIAGLLFACSPFLVSRSLAHFSLVAAAPLPFLVYFLDRAWASTRTAPAVAAGASIAWAWACDPYYAVYGLMLGGLFVLGRLVRVSTVPAEVPGRRHLRVLLDVVIVTLACVIAVVWGLGGRTVRIGSATLSVRSLYNPVMLLTLLVVARLILTLRPRVQIATVAPLRPMLRSGLVATAAAVVLLSPELVAIGRRVAEGRFVRAPIQWRSSPPGSDLLALVGPNPHHPLAPQAWRDWLDARPGNFHEQAAALPLVGIGLVLLAWRRGFRPSRFWVVVTAGFGALALGPFVHVAGANTYVPGPWVFLRYVPVVDAARMPPRFGIVAVLGLAVLTAGALAWLASRRPERRRLWIASAGALLAFELLPVPRTLYSAEVPAVYARIARDPRDVKVLSLPAGVRDGLSSLGDFSASSLHYQTVHGKPILDGYLSRVTPQRKLLYRRDAVMRALLELSEGRSPDAGESARALAAGPDFVGRTSLGYVVMESGRVGAELRQFAIDALDLVPIDAAGGYELYAPRVR